MTDDGETLFKGIGERMRQDLIKGHKTEMVCGPITTGGLGSVEKNLRLFNAVIGTLSGAGCPIWSQMPYEEEIFSAKKVWFLAHPGEAYCAPILDICYKPLFELRRFERAHFIPGRLPGPNHSKGTAWEFEQLQAIGIQCLDIEQELIDFIIEDQHI